MWAQSGPLAPQALWSVWNFQAAIVVPLELTVLFYLWGLWNVWQRAGAGHGIPIRRLIAFLGAMLALAAALVSPLDALSGTLFSAHMLQHLILILVAAPLLAGSDVPQALLWALPRRWAGAVGRRWNRTLSWQRAWHTLSRPLSAWLLFLLAVWGWHASALFEAALANETIHAAEHLTLLFSGLLFWRVLLRPNGPNHLRLGLAIPYLFTTLLHTTILGALMTFTTQAWYPAYAAGTANWGLTPLQDQQLAGLGMWVPGGLVFTALTIGYFAAWLGALERRSQGLQNQEAIGIRSES